MRFPRESESERVTCKSKEESTVREKQHAEETLREGRNEKRFGSQRTKKVKQVQR